MVQFGVMESYGAYAPFYDGSGQIRFALLTAHYLAEVLARHAPPGTHVLDLACGTGTLAIALAEIGWRVVGVDRSPAMLALARAKAEAAGVAERVCFVQGDMRDFWNAEGRTQNAEQAVAEAPPVYLKATAAANQTFSVQRSAFSVTSFSLITCTYDSLNYLLAEADLARCFAAVAQALAPGGVFYADMNTRHFLEHDWPAAELDEWRGDGAGFVQVSQSRFDPQTATSTMRLTGFAGDDEQGYQRFDETHVERAYPPDTIERLLEDAGLAVEGAYECFTFQPHHPRSQRIAWVARKAPLPAGER